MLCSQEKIDFISQAKSDGVNLIGKNAILKIIWMLRWDIEKKITICQG